MRDLEKAIVTNFLYRPPAFDPELEIHTWYMTRENYHDMRIGKLTNVVVPLFEKEYTLNLYGTTDFPYNETCVVATPSGSNVSIQMEGKYFNRLKYPIAARAENSGVYSITCYIPHNDVVEGVSHILQVKKSFNITFIRGIYGHYSYLQVINMYGSYL